MAIPPDGEEPTNKIIIAFEAYEADFDLRNVMLCGNVVGKFHNTNSEYPRVSHFNYTQESHT